MPKILFLYVDAGYGHRKVAEAACEELRSKCPSDTHIEIFDALKKTSASFNKMYPKIYHWSVVHAPWLWGFFFSLTNSPVVYPLISPLRTLWNWFQSCNLRNYIEVGNFDVIVLTHFFPAEVCAHLKKRGKIGTTLITIVTDVIPHQVWINPGTDIYWVMADESAKKLMKHGVAPDKIQIKGIPVSSRFSQPVDQTAIRKKIGLNENRLTILLTSGSFGIGPTEKVLNSFSRLKDQIQVIVVCGQNKVLFETLSKQIFSFPVKTLGFVDNMHELMSVSDLLIAKPGGATTCESLIKGLPMIMTSPIPGQEEENAKWLISHKAAFATSNLAEIKDIVSGIIANQNILENLKASIKTIAKPNAVKDLIDFILH